MPAVAQVISLYDKWINVYSVLGPHVREELLPEAWMVLALGAAGV